MSSPPINAGKNCLQHWLDSFKRRPCFRRCPPSCGSGYSNALKRRRPTFHYEYGNRSRQHIQSSREQMTVASQHRGGKHTEAERTESRAEHSSREQQQRQQREQQQGAAERAAERAAAESSSRENPSPPSAVCWGRYQQQRVVESSRE